MCGLCNLFGLGRRNNRVCETGCDTGYNVCSRRRQPRMNVYCASGIGTESNAPCGCDNDYNAYNNRCSSCERRDYDCGCDYDCD